MTTAEMSITEINEVLEWAANLAGTCSAFPPRYACESTEIDGGHEADSNTNADDLERDDTIYDDSESSIGSYESYMMDQLGMSWKDFY